MTDDRVAVREATPDELAAVLGVLDAAALETDADRIRDCIDAGDVLVAVPATTPASTGSGDRIESGDRTEYDDEAEPDDETLVGALVLDGDDIVSVAVRRRRRGQGIGTTLVETAATRRDRLVAEFDSDLCPFYESLGFDVAPVGDTDRRRGVLTPK